MNNVPYTVEVLDKLRWNAHLGKHKHFEAGNRGRSHHVKFGVPVVLINIALGSVLFAFLGDEGAFPQWAKWSGASLTLIAAGLGAVQTFFNFEKQYMEHRAVGNEYLGVARECERLLALYFDGLLPLHELSKDIGRINTEYAKVNARSEGLTVNPNEYAAALDMQKKKKDEQTSLLQRYAMSLSSKPSLQPTTAGND